MNIHARNMQQDNNVTLHNKIIV